MRAVGEAGQRRRVDLVAALLQNVDDLPPAPAAMIGAMNKHEGLARADLRQRGAVAERRRADPERRAAKRRSTRDRADIRHEILLDRDRVRRIASAADLKFLHRLPQACSRNFRSKAALESYACQCPFRTRSSQS